MRVVALSVVAFLSLTAAIAAVSGTAQAANNKKYPNEPVLRSASGTVIQPTRTIIHNADGSTTVITVRRRSYLDVGTEVPVGYGSRMDYAFPPGGDPGRPGWFYGPNLGGVGEASFARPFYIPGYNLNNPY